MLWSTGAGFSRAEVCWECLAVATASSTNQISLMIDACETALWLVRLGEVCFHMISSETSTPTTVPSCSQATLESVGLHGGNLITCTVTVKHLL